MERQLIGRGGPGVREIRPPTKKNVSNFWTVPIPLRAKENRIDTYTSVDEVIEKTQSQIDKLQDLKKATMNELLTKGIDHTEFKDSELGSIPKSWEVKLIDEIFDVRGRIGWKGYTVNDLRMKKVRLFWVELK